jgi:hypothetical protein
MGLVLARAPGCPAAFEASDSPSESQGVSGDAAGHRVPVTPGTPCKPCCFLRTVA